jgi:hypothetical protein
MITIHLCRCCSEFSSVPDGDQIYCFHLYKWPLHSDSFQLKAVDLGHWELEMTGAQTLWIQLSDRALNFLLWIRHAIVGGLEFGSRDFDSWGLGAMVHFRCMRSIGIICSLGLPKWTLFRTCLLLQEDEHLFLLEDEHLFLLAEKSFIFVQSCRQTNYNIR